ncbi:MAG TPA: tetratricopeptide repeat protein [Candidatus Aminicenantes bacterium]|nr:tetratricopeptide repeat protein [Candidatus Aminicenantes bacterium]
MKRTGMLLLLIMGLTPIAWGGANTAFAVANQQYEDGHYAEALDGYSQIAAGVDNWKLAFNMGNCCVKLERFVDAKIHYLRALRLAPTRREIRDNLEYVDEHLGHEKKSRQAGFLANLWNHFTALVSLNAISALLFLSVVWLNAFFIMLLWRGKRKWLVYGLGFALIVSLLLSGLQAFYQHRLDRRDTAVVIQSQARLRSGPGKRYTVLFSLRPGLDVRVQEEREQWLQVAAGDDVAGWIELTALEII